jgi:hypothetical protein
MSIPKCRCWNLARDGHQRDCAEDRELNRRVDKLLAQVAVGAPAQTIVLTDIDRRAFDRLLDGTR